MKKLTPILIILMLLSLLRQAPAQSTTATVQALQPGDTLPALRLQNVIHHPEGTINLQDYRGRWLILDFWATWCAPCIGMFPKADSLERLFKEELAFLPVTYQQAAEVELAFAKRKLLQGLRPPVVTADTVLRHLFPHKELPHYVWIDPQGVVRAVTDPDEVNAGRIREVLSRSDAAATFKQKEDNFLSFGRYDRLAGLNPLLARNTPQYSAVLTGFVEGLSGFYAYEKPGPGKAGRIIVTNASIPGLYQTAYSTGTNYYGENRTIYEVAKPAALRWQENEQDIADWLKAGNGFCYELQLPPYLAGREWELMRQDLDRLFPRYRARVEERKHPVLALVRTAKAEKFKSRGGAKKVDVRPYGALLQNVSLNALLMRLNTIYLQHVPAPLVDQTGYDGPVDLALDADMTDLDSLRKALQAYGLDLVEKKAKIKVLVIRDVAEKKR